MTIIDWITAVATPVALLVNAITLVAVFAQSSAATRQLRSSAHQTLTASWLHVGAMEVADPMLHTTLLGPRARAAVKNASHEDLKRRAFVHMVMDVISQKMRVERATRGKYPAYADIAFSNPEFCRMWVTLEVREAWDGDPLQPLYDELAQKTLKAEHGRGAIEIDVGGGSPIQVVAS
jgi:hypothetical protein